MDFDFLVGTYHVHNRRRTSPDGDWEEFTGTNSGRRYLDGQVVVDELEVTLPDGRNMKYVDVHAFDPAKGEWSNVIHASGFAPDWAPMVGRFEDGIGRFYQVTDVHLRHTWDRITPDSARFQQAVCTDGETWETTWVMELTRSEP